MTRIRTRKPSDPGPGLNQMPHRVHRLPRRPRLDLRKRDGSKIKHIDPDIHRVPAPAPVLMNMTEELDRTTTGARECDHRIMT